MKRAITLTAAFAAVALVTVSAQAEGKGEQIFKQKCAMCHSVKGKGGVIGPDLTKVATRLKEKEIKAKLEDPKKSNPATSMPSFKTLPPADLNALVGYIKTLK
jgi:mono/diheme cytochrome c family protein